MRSNISTGCWNVGTEGMKWYFVKWSSLSVVIIQCFKKHLVLYNRGSEYQSVTPPKFVNNSGRLNNDSGRLSGYYFKDLCNNHRKQ